ncbi:unnamed protein product, partial [Scytosiphon promiscuus]
MPSLPSASRSTSSTLLLLLLLPLETLLWIIVSAAGLVERVFVCGGDVRALSPRRRRRGDRCLLGFAGSTSLPVEEEYTSPLTTVLGLFRRERHTGLCLSGHLQ